MKVDVMNWHPIPVFLNKVYQTLGNPHVDVKEELLDCIPLRLQEFKATILPTCQNMSKVNLLSYLKDRVISDHFSLG